MEVTAISCLNIATALDADVGKSDVRRNEEGEGLSRCTNKN